ncbi:uncharacterized protein LOC134782577 [Penaeus indicus]|uniref:uncharacterized protein LOC134782577 n=1 Tax=Penaeus indicus TaxID=29960 RepID=UPI00300C037D
MLIDNDTSGATGAQYAIAISVPLMSDYFQVFALVALVVVAMARPDSPPTYGYSPSKTSTTLSIIHHLATTSDMKKPVMATTQGSYYVLYPDGRLQSVTYNLNGDSGYVADGTYEGEAQYPIPSLPTSLPLPPMHKKHKIVVSDNGNILQVFALAALVVVAIARPDSPPTYGYSAPTPSYAPAKYDFNYAVNDQPSGNDFGHEEARDGDHTQGSYYVLLPDGRLQRVTYNVNGDSGYVADVTYEGQAQYPTPKASYGPPQPSYKPPTPSYS